MKKQIEKEEDDDVIKGETERCKIEKEKERKS